MWPTRRCQNAATHLVFNWKHPRAEQLAAQSGHRRTREYSSWKLLAGDPFVENDDVKRRRRSASEAERMQQVRRASEENVTWEATWVNRGCVRESRSPDLCSTSANYPRGDQLRFAPARMRSCRVRPWVKVRLAFYAVVLFYKSSTQLLRLVISSIDSLISRWQLPKREKTSLCLIFESLSSSL